jgi:hypothetical protein
MSISIAKIRISFQVCYIGEQKIRIFNFLCVFCFRFVFLRIFASNNNGVYEGLHFGVYLEKQVAGKIAERQIGKLKVIEVQGPDISLCKVQSGGRDIKAAIDAGQNIVVKTME